MRLLSTALNNDLLGATRNLFYSPPRLIELHLISNAAASLIHTSTHHGKPHHPTSHSQNPPLTQNDQARNSEKAQSMLFRFRASQAADLGIVDLGRTRRPKNITSVETIPVAEKWRGQVLKEISRKVTKIQDQSLSDYQLRDLNDEINKLMREKWVWERQIRQLGGPNYMRGPGVVTDDQGREVPGGGKGYRYFGRARELPGVKEMFEGAAVRAREEREGAGDQRGFSEMGRKVVDAAYYGWNRDEEEGGGRLLRYEAKKEREARERLLREEEEHGGNGDWEPLPGDKGDGVRWQLPSPEEVQEEMMDRRRRKLLEKLGDADG